MLFGMLVEVLNVLCNLLYMCQRRDNEVVGYSCIEGNGHGDRAGYKSHLSRERGGAERKRERERERGREREREREDGYEGGRNDLSTASIIMTYRFFPVRVETKFTPFLFCGSFSRRVVGSGGKRELLSTFTNSATYQGGQLWSQKDQSFLVTLLPQTQAPSGLHLHVCL